jgi:hypoxanthine phosphoribosyltransferase
MVGTKFKIFVSWDSVETFVDILCDQITQSGKQVEYIFGMPRGGLIPAVILSHRLGIPMTQELTRQNTLVIDDICDSGETFKELFLKNPDAIFACLHFKPHTSAFNPNFAANIFPSDNWIVYPWEQDDSDTIQDYLK